MIQQIKQSTVVDWCVCKLRGDEQLEGWDEAAGREEHVIHAEDSRLRRGNLDELFSPL